MKFYLPCTFINSEVYCIEKCSQQKFEKQKWNRLVRNGNSDKNKQETVAFY